MSPTCGLKGGMEMGHLAGSACWVAERSLSFRQVKSPTRGNLMVERIELKFCTKFLFTSILTALLTKSLVCVPHQQWISCPASAHVFIC